MEETRCSVSHLDSNAELLCSGCATYPEDVLMLTCSHDLCLQCSAKVLKDTKTSSHRRDLIICKICSEATVLDEASVAELETISEKPGAMALPWTNGCSFSSVKYPFLNQIYWRRNCQAI
jgi:Zinc finger, C3HC4 type (RING finger)